MVRIQTTDEQINIYMSTLKVNAIEKKDADQTLTVKDAILTGATVADMSNFTFPAGMIVKYHDFATGTGNTASYSADEVMQESGITKTITFTAGNKIFAMGNACIHVYSGGDDVAGRAQLYDATNASATSGFGIEGINYVYSGASSATPQIQTGVACTGYLTPPGTSVTIGLAFGLTSGATVQLNRTKSWIQLFEIQQ